MAWTCYVYLDEDKTDVGTVRCVWDEGGPEEWTFTTRAEVSAGARLAVYNAANDAKTEHDTRMANNATYSSSLTTYFNAQ